MNFFDVPHLRQAIEYPGFWSGLFFIWKIVFAESGRLVRFFLSGDSNFTKNTGVVGDFSAVYPCRADVCADRGRNWHPMHDRSFLPYNVVGGLLRMFGIPSLATD
ncbi:hypothetical protein [Myxacorys almedinensis]|uniref:hypothetical protein n=1 Tax=Myxacorys almedinensis TaxID=2651157 RepID=UPI00192EBB4B|nr:hypothetical protein [Myxacorys almedinensis]